MPTSQLSDYPKPLTDLYDPSAETLSFDDLTIKCKEIYYNLVVTADQATVKYFWIIDVNSAIFITLHCKASMTV